MRRLIEKWRYTPKVLGLQPFHGREASSLAAALCLRRALLLPRVEPASPSTPHPHRQLHTLLDQKKEAS